MSQEDENYITPIFPLNSDEYQEGGAATIRNVTKFLDSYSKQIIGNFTDGYTLGTIKKTVVLPGLKDILIKDKTTKKIVPFKTFEDLKSSKLVADSLKTSPYFFLYQFFSKVESMDDLRIAKDTTYDQDKHLLLLEISVRFYVLIYLLLATGNTLCTSGTKATGDMFYKDFFQDKTQVTLKDIFLNFKSRWVDAEIQVCLFGIPKDDPAFTGFADFEILCKILYDYSLVIYLEGLDYPSDLIKTFQDSFYFSSMLEFVQEMEKKIAAMPAPVDDCAELKKVLDNKTKVKDPKAITKDEVDAITKAEPKYTREFIENCLKKTEIFKAGEYSLAPVAPPTKTDCEKIKDKLDEAGFVADKKAITDIEIAKLTAIDAKYTKDFVIACLKDTKLFPAGEYMLAPVAPPTKTDCEKIKDKLDEAGFVADKKAITDDEIAKLTAIDAKYTKDFIIACLKDTKLFPAGEYGLAPVAPPTKTDCEKIKDKLDEAGFVADKKAITNEEIAKLTAIDAKYTKEFVADCLTKTDIFPAGEYGLAPVAPPTKSDCEKIKDKLDEAGFVADKKAITDEEIAKLTAIDAKYTKDFVVDCLTKTDIFPAGEYALAPVAPPPEDKCIAFKAVLGDKSKVDNPLLITKEELDAITTENPEYTEEFLLNCFKNLELFPVDEYGLAFLPSATIKINCQRIKEKLDEAGFVADKKAITDEEIAKLTAIDDKFTKEFVTKCLEDTTLFPAGEYALEDPAVKAAAAAAAASAAANKAAANKAAANTKRADLKLRIEALQSEFETLAQNIPEFVGFINSESERVSGKGPSPWSPEEKEKIDGLKLAKTSLETLIPQIKSAPPEEFKVLYQRGLTVLQDILEKGQPLVEKYNTVAKKFLADQKEKYEGPMPNSPAEAAELGKFKLDYDKLATFQRYLDEILANLPDKVALIKGLQDELDTIKNTGASSGGRKKTRRAHRKTRRAKRSRNTRRKNRKA